MLYRTVYSERTPFEVFSSLRRHPHPFFLDSGMIHPRLGRFSFAGADPFLIFTCKGNEIRIFKQGKMVEKRGDPLEELRRLMRELAVNVEGDNGPPFIGGAVGYFGYDMGRHIERLPLKKADDTGIPDCVLGFYDGVYVFDHMNGTTGIVALGLNRPPEEILSKMETHLEQVTPWKSPMLPVPSPNRDIFRPNMTKSEYIEAIRAIKAYIRSGDIYQVNFTQRFECDFHGDPIDFYSVLRGVNPAPFAACFDAGECVIASSSPERLLQLRDGKIETRPIKGTCRRGRTPEEDESNRLALLQSEKDRAELLMIVDLERNDLSRICKPGTVKVTDLFTIESYPTVHHLVSTVTGVLRADCGAIDCIRAAFPGGSITGAPKVRAMEIIEELEPTRRNVYTGSMGYLGFDGSMDLNIVIRTVLIKGNRAFFQVGGGIVWDSVPESEFDESLLKAAALMKALSMVQKNEDLA